MPPRKQVYGKRARNVPTFAAATAFNWSSSPDRPPSSRDAENNGDEDVRQITEKLQATKIAASTKTTVKSRQKREPCTSVDVNIGNPEPARKTYPAKDQPHTAHVDDDIAMQSESIQEESSSKETEESLQPRRLRKIASRSTQETPAGNETTASSKLDKLASRTRKPRQTKKSEIPPTNSPDIFSKYTQPLLSLCADPAARGTPAQFAEWTESLEKYFHITKIAEASYGEVYRLSLISPRPGFDESDESVLKLIALKPPPDARTVKTKKSKEREAQMSTVEGVLSEVRLLQRMTSTPGFTNFREIRVLRGPPGGSFVKAWKDFNAKQKHDEKSTFPDPSRKGSYDENQLWAVIEMQDAGTDLEHFPVTDIWSCWDVFWEIALSLAKGEEEAQFEHRDLHLGNICCRRRPQTSDKTGSPANQSIPVLSPKQTIGFTNIETTIIDYTLSRANMIQPDLSTPEADAQVAFLDLEKEEGLFDGDAEVDYQYEIYRLMRDKTVNNPALLTFNDGLWSAYAACEADPNEASDSEPNNNFSLWAGFWPTTNLIWLHFILHTLLPRVSAYEAPSPGPDATRVERGKAAAATKKGKDLRFILDYVNGLLDPERIGTLCINSARELIEIAVEEKWLSERDVLELNRERT